MSFSLDLSRAIKKAKGKQELVVKKVMIEAFSKVVKKSPVDTGRFRGAWIASVGSYSRSPGDAVDKSGDSTIRKIKQDVLGMDISQRCYLVNALPYAIRIENGWSHTQAPQGVVKLTLAEITAHYGA